MLVALVTLPMLPLSLLLLPPLPLAMPLVPLRLLLMQLPTAAYTAALARVSLKLPPTKKEHDASMVWYGIFN